MTLRFLAWHWLWVKGAWIHLPGGPPLAHVQEIVKQRRCCIVVQASQTTSSSGPWPFVMVPSFHNGPQSGEKSPRSDLFLGVKNSDGEFQQVILCPAYTAGCNYSFFRKKENWRQFCSLWSQCNLAGIRATGGGFSEKKIVGRNYISTCLHSACVCVLFPNKYHLEKVSPWSDTTNIYSLIQQKR